VRIEVEALSHALLGSAEALARWWLSTGELSARQTADLLISTVASGLRERSAPAGLRSPTEAVPGGT
jgi:membrane protein required for beta-lactamase induction